MRIWRNQAAPLLLILALLGILALVYAGTATPYPVGLPLGLQILWPVLNVFLIWCTWRGARVAWVLLTALTGFALALLIVGPLEFGSFWPPYQLGLVLLAVIELALLFSPAIRGKVRHAGRLGHPSGTRP